MSTPVRVNCAVKARMEQAEAERGKGEDKEAHTLRGQYDLPGITLLLRLRLGRFERWKQPGSRSSTCIEYY